jgi:hypothetical protein
MMNKKEELIAKISDYDPHIIAITEVKPKYTRFPIQESEIQLDGFECIPGIEGEGRGVALYIKKSIQATKNETMTSLVGMDTSWCDIKLDNNDNLLIGCIYNSPNATPAHKELINKAVLEASRSKASHVLLIGDFNYPEIDWKQHSCSAAETHPSSLFLRTFQDSFLTQHVTEPTHHRGDQTANVLDLILTNEIGMVEDLEYLDPLGKSHHSTLTFTLQCYVTSNLKSREVYLYDKGNYVGLKAHFQSIDWQGKLQNKTTEETWDCIHETLMHAQQKFIPRITVKGIDAKKKQPLWMNEKALAKVRRKHAAWRRYMDTREGRDYKVFCKARNQAKWATRQAIRQFEKGIANNAKKNPAAFYKYVRSKTKTKSSIGNLEANGMKAETDQQKAEVLNNFFSSVFTHEECSDIPHFEDRPYTSPLDDITFSSEQIKKVLDKLNPNKSPGPDKVHPRILRELSSELANPLCILFSRSVDEGLVPSMWKQACITPLFKKGSKKSPGNYRPVSLTPILCKVMERLVRDSIVKHLKTNELLADEQHGFISGRSCVTQLLETVEDWTKIIDDRGGLDVVYFDFMKAFDTVPHCRLAHKLRAYGIQGKVLDWVKAFLKQRTQQVAVNGSKSSLEDVVSGVPQGSVLGPVLFVVYINDLPERVRSQIKLFADDTKLYRRVSTIEDCRALQDDINALENWSRDWLLKFHPEKCKVMRIGRGQPDFTYTMSSSDGSIVNLEVTNKEKDLGVWIDDKLNFKEHAQVAAKKANRIVGLIRRSMSSLDTNTFPLLFRSLVRPLIEYANTVWAPRFKGEQDLVEQVQRRATRLVPGLADLSYTERLKVLKLPSLSYRRKRGDLIEMYKMTHGLYDIDTSWLPWKQYHGTRGHSFQIAIQHCNLDLRKNVFSHRAAKLWNSLPTEVAEAPSTDAFKARVDRYFGSQIYEV